MIEPYDQEREPLQETFKKDKLDFGIDIKKPNKQNSQKTMMQYTDGTFSNMMSNYVMHLYDPVFDPSAQHMVPANLKHHDVYRHPNHTKGSVVLPLQPHQHPINHHTPMVLDIPSGWTDMNYSWSHDQYTANPPDVGIGPHITLLQN